MGAMKIERPEVGTRVGVIESEEDGEVRFMGYGVYEGEDLFAEELTTPRLRLDCGVVVHGYECWWTTEEKMKTFLEGKTVVQMDMRDDRLRFNYETQGKKP